MTHNPVLIRAAILLVPVTGTWIAALYRRPSRRLGGAAALASIWVIPSSLAVHFVALRLGWWSYGAQGGVFAGMPLDLLVGWALMWGALPLLALPRAPILYIVVGLLWIDVAVMPVAYPVILLGRNWLIGELLEVAVVLLPALLLGRWAAQQRHLSARALMQCLAFTALSLWLVPLAVLQATHATFALPHWPGWLLSVVLELLAIPAAIGLSAVQEFASKGHGTPFPYDPPTQLVRTGPYRYIRNPMQASMTVLVIAGGALLGSPWVAVAGIMAAAFSAGVAQWHEGGDLDARFGAAWWNYAGTVRAWVPRWKPAAEPAGQLFLATTCLPCDALSRWLAARHPVGLEIRAAELLLAPRPVRGTYVAGDGTVETGVNALGRALEHLNLGWALVGFAIRLPLVRSLVQVFADAIGAGPRAIGDREAQPGTGITT